MPLIGAPFYYGDKVFFIRGSNPLFPTKFLFSFHLFPVHRFAFSKGLVGGFLLKKGDRIC